MSLQHRAASASIAAELPAITCIDGAERIEERKSPIGPAGACGAVQRAALTHWPRGYSRGIELFGLNSLDLRLDGFKRVFNY